MKRRMMIWLGIPLVLAGLSAGGIWWAVRLFDPCVSEIVESVEAPAGAWTATVYLRNCGASTRLTINVSVTPSGTEPKGPGNVLAAYQTDIDVDWDEANPNRLVIHHGPATEIFRQERRLGDIQIHYEAG